jgi:hypothetical protein
LQRHGARWPTSDRGAGYKATIEKLQGVKHYKKKYLDFLKDFTWDFGTEDLLPLGVNQCASIISVLWNHSDAFFQGHSKLEPLPLAGTCLS